MAIEVTPEEIIIIVNAESGNFLAGDVLSGVPEAPGDGQSYARRGLDATWQPAYDKTEADAAFDASGSAAAVQAELDAHEADLANPHAVTAAQAGADPAGSAAAVQTNLDTHEAAANPHSGSASLTDLGNHKAGGTGEHPKFTSDADGFVPSPGAGSGTRILQEDATWVEPSGGGGIPEAPNDGGSYVRRGSDSTWQPGHTEAEADAAYDEIGSAAGVQANLDAHEAETAADAVHGSTSLNTATSLMSRDANGTTALAGLSLDTAGGAPDVIGMLRWNNQDLCAEFVSDGVTTQIGQEVGMLCRNISGAAIAEGAAVYVTGAQGNKPTIGLADASTKTESRVVGLVTQESGISNNGNGFVTVFGLVRGINTSAFVDGDRLYLSETPGEWTDTEPTTESAYVAPIGGVTSSAVNGEILVNVDSNPGTVVHQRLNDATSELAARNAISAEEAGAAAAVQANLDTHTGDTSIHFADALADGKLYARQDSAWTEVFSAKDEAFYAAGNISATWQPDLSNGGNQRATMTADTQLNVPTLTAHDGLSGNIVITTGGFALTLGAGFSWLDGSAPDSTDATDVVLSYVVEETGGKFIAAHGNLS